MSKKLLVVVDMQNDFIDGALGTPEAQAIVDKVADYMRNFDGAIICTMDTHYKDASEYGKVDYLETQEGKNLPIEHCIFATHGWNLHDRINAIIDELNQPYIKKVVVREKETFASIKVGLEVLRNYSQSVDEVELCGLCTDICVISNALLIKAFAPEVKIKVHKNLCAGVTPESHETALKAMSACQIEIVD